MNTLKSMDTSLPLYAVIDLGSNSFHMLITRQLANSVQVVDKVKRKVRLASGLDKNNTLSEEAMVRGLECLNFFAERLQGIPKNNIRIVATATLRLAKNRSEFITRANKLLCQDIDLLSGEQEARYIYQGVAHTSCCSSKRLVVDIGGASTEIVVGNGTQTNRVVSLDMGCVTFNNQFFESEQLTEANFEQAINIAKLNLEPLVQEYKTIGWQTVLGGSGTMQALAEILLAQNKPSIIQYRFLLKVKKLLIDCSSVNQINIKGLSNERTPVIASGLSILIAIFESFDIDQLQLSNGALREGLLYEMLPTCSLDIRQRTINSLMQRYHVDARHAENVTRMASLLFESLTKYWHLQKDKSYQLLLAACQIHEIGLLIEFKYHQKHNAYIVENSELPGFDQADKQLLKVLVKYYKDDIQKDMLNQPVTDQKTIRYLLAIIRIASILCRQRNDDDLPCIDVSANNERITLNIPSDWLEKHPLIKDELNQENTLLQTVGLSLAVF